ncbi:flagellar basal body protein [Aquisalinus flavus]|uniref:Flagellar biosynthesis protein FlgB n=1 Tax=Aquisalinus flavus TaxID=1526572 RepID=A0A8J2V3F4_9PROT|nr:flagellar basal body protein [Aquisalinus flavus]MBD0425920.1 flagellar biosynthesis protein FlgB [Aquisalinus flavus]UNE48486.1 flagellar biosynthesis protein FlgB [Aquisalinus flavus]GGD12210.1 flagellar biosynthesis protein FlgB [Aquisalinus flavus]
MKILDSFSALSRYAAQRHSVLSDNIANANTPGYKAQDLQPFEDYFSKARQLGAVDTMEAPIVRMETKAVVSPNGNNVSLDEQMLKTAEAKGQHDMALAVYKKTLDIFRLALGRNV